MQQTFNTPEALHGRTPLEEVTGKTPNISEYLDIGFYNYVWFRKNAGLGEKKLARWLGVSHRVGNQMSCYVLRSNCEVLSRTTVQRVTNLELQTDKVKSMIVESMTQSKSNCKLQGTQRRRTQGLTQRRGATISERWTPTSRMSLIGLCLTTVFQRRMMNLRRTSLTTHI